MFIPESPCCFNPSGLSVIHDEFFALSQEAARPFKKQISLMLNNGSLQFLFDRKAVIQFEKKDEQDQGSRPPNVE